MAGMEQPGIYSTPANSSHGVVAMTPSSSGRPLYPAILPRMLAPPPRFVLSPSPSEQSFLECELVDIVSELLKHGVPQVVKKILSYLPPEDIIRCSRVCENWNSYISNEFLGTTINIACASTGKTCPANDRQALSRIDANAIYTPPQTPVSSIPRPHMQARICPICRKSAKVLNLRRAACLSPNCKYDFCTQCFKEWHHGSKCKRDYGSENIDSEKLYVAGSKKSKKRLKRL